MLAHIRGLLPGISRQGIPRFGDFLPAQLPVRLQLHPGRHQGGNLFKLVPVVGGHDQFYLFHRSDRYFLLQVRMRSVRYFWMLGSSSPYPYRRSAFLSRMLTATDSTANPQNTSMGRV